MTLKIAKVETPAELKPKPGQDRSRDETQQQVDGEVGTLKTDWLAMTDHAKVPVDRRPRTSLAVAPEDKTDLKAVIRRAGTFNKVSIEWFEEAVDPKGRAVVTFSVGPPVTKKH